MFADGCRVFLQWPGPPPSRRSISNSPGSIARPLRRSRNDPRSWLRGCGHASALHQHHHALAPCVGQAQARRQPLCRATSPESDCLVSPLAHYPSPTEADADRPRCINLSSKGRSRREQGSNRATLAVPLQARTRWNGSWTRRQFGRVAGLTERLMTLGAPAGGCRGTSSCALAGCG